MGMVTDIQRFSLNDGPGIRTTVFLKGCNARCAWCHNPETLETGRQWLISPDNCIGCGACVGFKKGVSVPPAREALTPEAVSACYSDALIAAGREMSAGEVMREVVQDKKYYETSGGGVTLSGGEAMMQPDFVREILTRCRAEGIKTAVETNLLYDWAVLENALPLLDLVMADIKLMDDVLHQKYVGLSNRQVLGNVSLLGKTDTTVILRTPVVPGLNDNETEISKIAKFIAGNSKNLQYYELLNFNPLGDSKYDRLDVKNPYREARPLSAERMEQLSNAAKTAGITVRVG